MSHDNQPPRPSGQLLDRARAVMPGGNTRTTIFSASRPRYARAGRGCFLEDVDGSVYLDCLNNYTSLIHGHSHPRIVAAVVAQLERGTCFSMPTEAEIALAEMLTRRAANVERIRFTNSGTEAVMVAVKAARAFTGRSRIAKVEGAYHGSYDGLEISEDSSPDNWGPREAPTPTPYSAGLSPAIARETVVLPFNDVDAAEGIVAAHAAELAAIVVDPLPARVGLLPATTEWLSTLRRLADDHGIVLVSDEVISFRTAPGGAQEAFGFRADLTTLGKIIGGGLPIGAVGGRADIMAVFDPSGGKPAVPHGGTFNANPISMAAGLAAMELFDRAALARLDTLGWRAADGIRAAFASAGRPGQVTGRGSLLRVHLTDRPLHDYRSAYPTKSMQAVMRALVDGLAEAGVLIAPSGLLCLSTAMNEPDVDRLIDAMTHVLPSLTMSTD